MTRRYKQSPRVASRNFRGEAAIITPEDRRIHILNPTATVIWELCRDAARPVDEICGLMADRYEGDPDVVRNDVVELLDQLVALGALQHIEESGPE